MIRSVLICVLLPILANSLAIQQNRGVKQLANRGSSGVRYYLVKEKVSHNEAELVCQEGYGGKLVSILNGLESSAISELLKSDLPSGYVHTSGVRASINDPFFWTSVSTPYPVEATHFRWAPGAPNAQPTSLCIIAGHNIGTYQWYATSCDEKREFICEI